MTELGSSTDEQLVRNILEGQDADFTVLVERYMPMVMAIACRYQHLLPSEALNTSTINAACAVGLGERIGSIEVGKQADILILDTSDYRHLAYQFGGNLVEAVFKRGEMVVG